MVIFGASGHAKVIIDCLEASNFVLKGIFDDDETKKELLGYKVFGSYDIAILPKEKLVIAIGNNQIRERLSKLIKHIFGVIKHPTALIHNNVLIEEGSVIFHYAIIQSSAKIGKHVIVNTKSSIDHDCIISDFVHIAPNATLCGGVTVGEGTLIGAGSVIIPNVKIGKWAIIGAGSVIIEDVPDFAVVVGNPGKIKRYNK